MSPETFRIGEVARRAGVSVRTLHYYHEIGLLTPATGSSSGHRLYRVGDIERLQQIKSLQHLGFTLAEIGELLDRPETSLRTTLQNHLERLNEQIRAQQALLRSTEFDDRETESRRKRFGARFAQLPAGDNERGKVLHTRAA